MSDIFRGRASVIHAHAIGRDYHLFESGLSQNRSIREGFRLIETFLVRRSISPAVGLSSRRKNPSSPVRESEDARAVRLSHHSGPVRKSSYPRRSIRRGTATIWIGLIRVRILRLRGQLSYGTGSAVSRWITGHISDGCLRGSLFTFLFRSV